MNLDIHMFPREFSIPVLVGFNLRKPPIVFCNRLFYFNNKFISQILFLQSLWISDSLFSSVLGQPRKYSINELQNGIKHNIISRNETNSPHFPVPLQTPIKPSGIRPTSSRIGLKPSKTRQIRRSRATEPDVLSQPTRLDPVRRDRNWEIKFPRGK